MIRNLYITGILSVLSIGSLMAQNNDITVTIQNQRQDSTEFTFDIYLNTDANTTYLGDADFVFEFDNAGKWAGSASVALSNVFSSPAPNAISTTILSTGDIAVNVQGVFGATALNEFPAIGTTPIRLATVTVTTVDDFTADPGLAAVTGTGLTMSLFEVYDNGTKLQQAEITNRTFVDPAAGGAPIAAPANFMIAASTSTSVDLSWDVTTDSVLIVARKGDPIATGPLNTIKYDGNNAFGSGEQINIGAGAEYVVARNAGTNNSATITGLETGVAYNFAIYEFTGGLGRTEAYGPAAEISSVTLDNEPTVQPAAITFANIDQTTMTVQVDNTGGDGDNIIVLAYPVDTTSIPALVDGTTYSADAAYGSEELGSSGVYIIYAGSAAGAASINVTGLTAGEEYTFTAYAYNDNSGTSGAENYLLTAPATADQFTLFPEPVTALNALTATTSGVNAIDVAWTDAEEADNNWIIVARLSADAATAPVAGTEYTANAAWTSGEALGNGYVVYNGDGTAESVTVTGLDQNESYAFDIYAYTGSVAADSLVLNYSNTSAAGDTAVTWIATAVTAALEGAYNGTDMAGTNITVPTSQPYNAAPWNYAGTENFASVPANTVDWVLLELRGGASASGASEVIATQAALILEDGSIVSVDGTSTPVFEIDSAGVYYVAVQHRNHLAVSSASALTDNGTSDFTFDFTTSGATGTDAVKNISGTFVLYGGRAELVTTSGTIDAADYNAVYNDLNNATATYELTDVNLDGVINAADRALIFNNNGNSEQLPE